MEKIKKISENIWEIEKQGKMNVPGIVFASDALFEKIKDDKTLEQIKNASCLPGIIEKSIAMPDAHQGYGLCIGGVIAFDNKKGIVSPGATGYDINCGVRLLTTNVKKEDFMAKRKEVLNQLARDIPSGVGRESNIKLTDNELNDVLDKGVNWALENKYVLKEDLENIEDNGCIKGADSSKVSPRAKARGRSQLGTLGSGNHFLEIQEVESIYDEKISKILGIENKGQIVIMIHSGSRGLGHQTASDYIMNMEKEYGWEHLPDRELICAPIESELGKDYISAMRAAANFAFVNRQIITYHMRKVFSKFFPKSKLDLVYDICHNIVKFEDHLVNGKKQTLCVHRKGATRSFGPGREEIPKKYRKIGCPIFIPGSMGTFSYVLIGTKKAEEISFGSTAHGAGRVLSRTYAIKNLSTDKLQKEMKDKDIMLKAGSIKGALEEAPEAYKDVNEVARVSHELGIGQLVARMKPLAVIKG
jgi:tRNA-splicing ligase RtcB (3'-phosphate/5'-hydroxy nucleic acid ligase)